MNTPNQSIPDRTFELLRFLSPEAGLRTPPSLQARPVIGVIEGSGIGPQVILGALHVLATVEQVTGRKFELRHGSTASEATEKESDTPMSPATANFFAEIFARGGAVLNGPRGGRYVYELRHRFDLFCKFVPVRPCPQLARSAPVAGEQFARVNMLIVRDNSGGVYQGQWSRSGQTAEHRFSYTEAQVRRLADVSARAAAARQGKMHVIIKDGGVPSISDLWREVSLAAAQALGVQAAFMNIDLAAYELIRNPAQFDVMLTPNLFGDILVDISGALLGSRGATFSGNYDAAGHGVYQTNHGCAHDLAWLDVANPAGQILSLAMLLRESFGLNDAATLIEQALAETWQQGYRTTDVAEPGCTIVGTQAMCEHVSQNIFRLAEKKSAASEQ